jgi:hypothetical protein
MCLRCGRNASRASSCGVAGTPREWITVKSHDHARLPAVSTSVRIERGWIYIDGARQDDATIKLGTGDEMRFSPFEAISDRRETQITSRDILKASVQRLAFWRR